MKCHSSVLTDVKPIGYMLDPQRCGRDSAASFKTLMNLYDISTRVLKDYSVPKYRQIVKKMAQNIHIKVVELRLQNQSWLSFSNS